MVDLVRRSLCVLLLLAFAFAPIACAPTDPMAKIAAARDDYEAQLSSWIIRPPAPPEIDTESEEAGSVEGAMAPAAEEGEGEEGEGEEGEGEMLDEPEPVDPRSQVVLFDIIVLYSGSDPLPGITVDISHVGADGAEKAVRRHYLEVPTIRRGSTEQVAVELDGWDLADGDSFAIDVRQGLSEAERGEYREFQNAG